MTTKVTFNFFILILMSRGERWFQPKCIKKATVWDKFILRAVDTNKDIKSQNLPLAFQNVINLYLDSIFDNLIFSLCYWLLYKKVFSGPRNYV